MSSSSIRNEQDAGDALPQPHAFHQNLPPPFLEKDGVPLVTKFAAHKAQQAVDLAFSIQLTEGLFECHGDDDDDGEDNDPMETEEEDANDDTNFEEDMEDPVSFHDDSAETLQSLSKRCSRLNTILSSLENLKFNGITQSVLMDIVLHLFRLLTATVTYKETDGEQTRKAVLHFENVGTILQFGENASTNTSQKSPQGDLEYKLAATEEELAAELAQNFALPSPCRETILLTLLNLLSNKGPLRSVSNAAIYAVGSSGIGSDNNDDNPKNRSLLILQWKPLLRMLLRTAPYLNEHKAAGPVTDSNSRTSNIVKRSVQVIRDARHFFEQGVRPPSSSAANNSHRTTEKDLTAREIWDMVQSDVLFHSHTHACYRGTILLYLFQPSRCTEDYYRSVLPHWWTAWTNIDRCPEYDFLWLALFSRARKYVKDYDWSPIRKRLLTHSQYWLQLPIGGTSLDKSFPRAPNPRSRSCPPRLKIFAGSNSSYDEGIDFVAKVTKLLVAGLGTGDLIEKADEQPAITEGTNDVLRFLSFVTPYFHPSNLGQWTFTLGAFLHYFAYELCCRMGAVAGNRALLKSHPAVVQAINDAQRGSHCAEIPPHEVVALMDALLPLCQQALYSKNGHVGRAGEAAMVYLVQIDPANSTPFFIDFACRALDVSAINQSHQAPAALSALTRLVQPALRSDPSILLARLPELLRLSLAGIDSNDQNKTIRTLILYRNLASWIPIGGDPDSWPRIQAEDPSVNDYDGTLRLGKGLYDDVSASRNSKAYNAALERLPPTSLLRQGVSADKPDLELQRILLDEATKAMSDWALDFLDRIFGLLRSSGEREKTAKRASGVASRHSSADVHQARNFSRVLKECMLQIFVGMDEETHKLAVRTVVKFLEEETHPAAAKDASLLCQAVAAARLGDVTSPGLDALVPLLTDDLSHHSTKTVAYRLRCLAGAVRAASHAVVKHHIPISAAIDYALSSDDRHLFKTGCKLLRHTLSTLVESYPIAADSRPRSFLEDSSSANVYLGRSAQLHGDSVQWHVPNGESIDFAWSLLKSHVVGRLDSLCEDTDGESNGARSKMLNSPDVNALRRCLRVIRYAIRGGASVMLDSDMKSPEDKIFVPYEEACLCAIASASAEARESLFAIRGRLCAFLVVLSSVIASETLYPDGFDELSPSDPYRKILPLISSDPKICKETSDLSLLLLTRRGSAFRSTEARSIWKAQKQLASDYMMCAQVDHMAESLQCASIYGDATAILYKDGEDGGKTVPRRLLVARVQLFHDSLQRSASFEIPRRLRRLERETKMARNRLFSVKTSLSGMVCNLESILVSAGPSPLDAYEGLADGLYALCCHSNTQVRASALSVIDYTMTRFGWLVAVRVPRLLSGLALKDEGSNGKFGIPSCSALVGSLNHQGKRKKLAEAVKGVCSILSLSRAMKHVLESEKLRAQFSQTVCSTDGLISLLPTEEMQKLVHYLQAVFSPFRSKIYAQPRVSSAAIKSHKTTLNFVLGVLSEKKAEGSSNAESPSDNGGAVHWRKRLLACWFLLSFVDEGDLVSEEESALGARTWATCYRILETEKGQPLQRVALGLFGRLLHIASGGVNKSNDLLRRKMLTESFCRTFGEALVYDHREDTSVGGGHDAQWATGVEDIIRDAARNIAPRTLFPFQRTSQAHGSFKATHAQLLQMVLSSVDEDTASVAIQHLLNYSKEIAAAPPSEDQRNQQITSAEIFAGICAYRLRSADEATPQAWNDSLLPHLDDVMGKIPFSLSGAYFDSIRYALQFCPPSSFFPLTNWLVDRISSTLWQPSSLSTDADTANGEGLSQMSISGSTHGSEGFTAQSKWMYLFTAVLIEMDESEAGNTSPAGWYTRYLTVDPRSRDKDDGADDPELEVSWQLVIDSLLPRLTAALGHPFDSCRDHISRCLFRICYCHRKRARLSASRVPSRSNSFFDDNDNTSAAAGDPGTIVVRKLASLENTDGWQTNIRYNALSTARRFISFSVHLGEAKFEYSDYVIPLLPLAFEAIKSTVDEDQSPTDVNQEENAANRALEAEVIKGYRYTIAELSITAVISYGRESDIAKVLDVVGKAYKHEKWQVRHAAINFLRCFQGAHQFIFTSIHSVRTMEIVADLLADERREVSSAAMAALTGILAASPIDDVARMVKKYISIAGKSKKKRQKKNASASIEKGLDQNTREIEEKELKRAKSQKTAVFFLCATIMAQPYDTPLYVPAALAAISKHSFERNAPLGVRDTVKRCCAEYKKTHMSDNWEVHRAVFTQDQLEALEDVVSSPHYYA